MPTANGKLIKIHIYLSLTHVRVDELSRPVSHLNIYAQLINECLSGKTAASQVLSR